MCQKKLKLRWRSRSQFYQNTAEFFNILDSNYTYAFTFFLLWNYLKLYNWVCLMLIYHNCIFADMLESKTTYLPYINQIPQPCFRKVVPDSVFNFRIRSSIVRCCWGYMGTGNKLTASQYAHLTKCTAKLCYIVD